MAWPLPRTSTPLWNSAADMPRVRCAPRTSCDWTSVPESPNTCIKPSANGSRLPGSFATWWRAASSDASPAKASTTTPEVPRTKTLKRRPAISLAAVDVHALWKFPASTPIGASASAEEVR